MSQSQNLSWPDWRPAVHGQVVVLDLKRGHDGAVAAELLIQPCDEVHATSVDSWEDGEEPLSCFNAWVWHTDIAETCEM